MKCKEPDCEGTVEANMSVGFTLRDDGEWELVYMGDNEMDITCDASGHDNFTPALAKSLSAHIEEILPGTTWEGSDPRLQEEDL